MKIGEICNRQVVVIGQGESLLEAGRRMRENHVGCLVVVRKQEASRNPVGILTDRDILMQVLSKGVALEKIGVEDIMVPDLFTAREEDGIYETIRLMRRKGIRRMPVVDSRRDLVGIVTMNDLLKFLSEEVSRLADIFSRGRIIETVARP